MKNEIVLLVLFAFLMTNCKSKVNGCRHYRKISEEFKLKIEEYEKDAE